MENSIYRQGKAGRFLYALINKFMYFTPILLSNWKFRRCLLIPLYKIKALEAKESDKFKRAKTVLYMVQPETTFSGGLSDRLRAIISIYKECKKQGYDFRIVFEPLHLQDYLEPNQYDWRISNEDIVWDTERVFPCTILTYHHNLQNPLQRFAQRTVLRYFLQKKYEQIHVYSNMATEEDEYGILFDELFKPTQELQEQIEYHLARLGGRGNYISLTFRFRQLLGDFKEGGETLPEEDRRKYIERCITRVQDMHKHHPGKKILVTSDSSTFLNELMLSVKAQVSPPVCDASSNWLYVIPGRVVHFGFTFDAGKKTYMKSFIDYYMLSYASTVYLVRDKQMYHSGFPERAAMLYDTNYEEINLN